MKWPDKGKIEFIDVEMSYRKDLTASLQDFNLKVEPGMSVGIVGRTGAGKSSILQALFRLVDPNEGKVLIDGVDYKSVGLHLLRQNLSFIPQSPFLMSGTIRENLDPFNEH